MQFILLTAALATAALAMPEPVSGGASLGARAGVKLNQYANLDDCNNDRNILYHAAPVSGRCYTLDDKTGAFFYNTGGYLQSYSYDGNDCTGAPHKFQRYTGRCVEKGAQRSVKFE